MFSKILVANRGEIAVRVIRACKEMGIATVSVYSTADSEALHVALADRSFCIGGAEAADSYLNEERVISAALVSGAQAIHPGYGFLSENARFAQLCRKNGVVFIGPTEENMKRLGDKVRIKRLMREAGLTVIPGTGILDTVAEAKTAAEKTGYPVMIKAASGGGGRGIRLVKGAAEMENAFLSAGAEAKAAFGDAALYIEKYVHPAKHVEMQVLADEAGNVVCLGERDCSVQRNNQKLIEESPCPAVSALQRGELIRKVTRAVRDVGYVGAGTLEFLLDGGGNFYFMEMNVRLQVEHSVTEALTGIDIVKWQIRTAAGVPLSFRQEDVSFEGSAIECRINALAPGRVGLINVPGGPFVRFDTFLVSDNVISHYYDPLLGKLIVCAGTREEAIRKMLAALCELMIEGVSSNIEEQIGIIGSEAFKSGDYIAGFIAK